MLKRTCFPFYAACFLFAQNASAQKATAPLVDSTVVFGATKGIIAVEAEYFYKQSKTGKRAWYINSPQHHPQVWPDHDTASYIDASGLAYMEALPDLFHSDDDPIIEGDNLGSVGGSVAVLHYNIFFETPGRYYLWTRLRSNDEEDNTTAAGVDGSWPPSAKTLQSPVNKKRWIWKSDNRISRNPWKIGRAYLDIPTSGVHDVQFSMREDGEEFDRFVLTTDSLFSLGDEVGPQVKTKTGGLPKPFSVEKQTADVYHAWNNPDGSVYGANILYGDSLNLIAFEAEDFYRQTKTESRMWRLVTESHTPIVGPDGDGPHLQNASRNAYLELLPDARQKDEDAVNSKSSIKGAGGQAAVVSYMVDFPAPGVWYVWVRGLNTDGDDNTLHMGINDAWPESGKKMMFGNKQWKWSNTQRDTKAPITIDIPAKGRHEFMLSMREDGCEIDRILLSADKNFKPDEAKAYPSKIKKGNMENWYKHREAQLNTAGKFVGSSSEVVIECESVPASTGWAYHADSSGHTGFGYYEWSKPGQGIKPGEGILKYSFQITQPGDYQFFIRGSMKDPANRPETPDADGNDVWVKFSGGRDVKAEASLDSSWNKIAILGHPQGWTWNTNLDKTKEHSLTPVCRYFDKGVYTVSFSGRSQGYAIDRLLLLKYTKKPTVDFEADAVKKATLLNESVRRRL